jgi:hypothetical protein
MKPLLMLGLSLLIGLNVLATKITLIKPTAAWSDNSAWDLNRQPQSGDTIVIPAHYFVYLDYQANLNGVVIQVFGTLRLQVGELNLDNKSRITVSSTGVITGTSNNDWIKIGSTLKFTGTESYQAGPSYADKTTGFAPVNGFATNLSLPVTFVSFYLAKNSQGIELTWTTAQESGNDYFDLEKSTDGLHWTVMASVKGSGNSSVPVAYSYLDKNANAAVLYYRIHQVDFNGQSVYTSVKTIHPNGANSITKIYSSGKTVNVEFNSEIRNNFSIRILNMSGQLVAQQSYQQSAYRITFNMSQAGSGAYVVQVLDGNGLSESGKIIL